MISLQKVKPITPGRRQLIKLNQKSLNLSKKPMLKNKVKGLKNSSGRNNSGRITAFHRGGGVKNDTEKLILIGLKIQPLLFVV
jgi:large subunit ribosomal protein L2